MFKIPYDNTKRMYFKYKLKNDSLDLVMGKGKTEIPSLVAESI